MQNMQLAPRIDLFLHRDPSPWWFVLCLCLVAGIGLGDYATGEELSLSILYLAPICLASWMLGRGGGLTFSMLASATWLTSIFFAGRAYSHPFYYFWDASIKFVTFAIFAVIISKLKIALSRADERFVTVLEGLDAAVYVSDVDGRLLYANERFRRSIDAGSSLLDKHDPPKSTSSSSVGALPTDGLRPGVLGSEFYDPNSGRWYLVHTRSIRWVDGKTVRLQLATDITDRKNAEKQNLEQQERLQMTERLIALGEMASTLAHEINQPLAAISNYNMGCVRRLRSGEWNSAELLSAMEKASAQAERAGKVIQRIREFVRKREPDFAVCSLNEIVRGVAALIEVEAEINLTRLVFELGSDVPCVNADPVMIEQVVLNLVRNGIESMSDLQPGNRQLVIRSTCGSSDAVEVSISDNGCGIDVGLQRNLFMPFFTTKPHGTGLGLHVCRSIVEMHSGRLWYTPNPSEGSVFHFSLPAAQP